MTAKVAAPVPAAPTPLAVTAGMYLTDGARLAFVKRASRTEVVLEIAGGLGPGYSPDDNPVLLRQKWPEFRGEGWRMVVPRG